MEGPHRRGGAALRRQFDADFVTPGGKVVGGGDGRAHILARDCRRNP